MRRGLGIFAFLLSLVSCSPTSPESSSVKLEPKEDLSVFIIDTGKPLKSGSGVGDTVNNQLWLKNNITGKKSLIVECKDAYDMRDEIADIQNPQFSPDRTKIYFESAAWVTSNSIHVFDLKTSKEHFFTSGSELRVIGSGKYAGSIIVSKHKYFSEPGGGSYDNYYLVDASGHEVMNLGDPADMEKIK